jgi:hypothetical protein
VIGVSAVTLTFSAIALAGKPGGGGSVPPGRIYFRWTNEVYAEGGPFEFRGWWSMNADGSGKELTPHQPLRSDHQHHLSYLTHQGHYWYLEVAPSATYERRSAVYAVRDDGDPAFTVVLLEAEELPGRPWPTTPRWAKDDSFMSFVARVEGETPEPARIWAAGLAFDNLTGVPVLTTSPVPVVDGEQSNWRDIQNFDWSPDGSEIAYGLEPNGDLGTVKIKNLDSGETRVLGYGAYSPTWSPDGLTIAFKPFNQGVHLIRPDGTGLVRLTNNSWDLPTGWSPDGKHVLFWRGGYYKGSGVIYIADVFRIPVAGGSAVNLTKDIDGYATSTDWR